MNNSLRNTHIWRLVLSCAMFVALFAASSAVNGQTVTFAQFFERNGTQDFIWTNNGGISGTFSTVAGSPPGSPIFFTYQNIVGLDPSLQGIQLAHMTVTTTAFQSGSVNGSTVTQPLDQIVTIEITRDTPAPPGVGGGSRTRLLRAVITPAANTPGLTGTNGGNSANLNATTPDHNVVFTSHFLSFAATTQRNMALSFSSVTPGFSLGLGGFLQSLTAAGSGTFASNPVPVYVGPTAANVSVGGRVFGPNGRAVGNALVTLTEGDGTVRTARTSSFGYFQFDDVSNGQAVLVAVRSKRYTYEPQLISLQDSALDLSFTPVP